MVEPKDRKTSKIVNDVARSQFRTSFYWIGIKEVGIRVLYWELN